MEMLIIVAVVAVVAAFDLAAIRFGVDSRDRSVGNDWGIRWNG
jgi:hypothetical protein